MDIYSSDESVTSDNVINNKKYIWWYFTRFTIKNSYRYYSLFKHYFSCWFVWFFIWFINWCCYYYDIKNLYLSNSKHCCW